MSSPAQRSARVALDAARPAVARLDAARGTEDLAADLIEAWSAVEAALRSLVGSSVLSGQPLIREARQRQLINFDQANSLAEFQAVHDRLQNTSYHATPVDVTSARDAFLKLDAGLSGDNGVEPPRAWAAGAKVTTPAILETPTGSGAADAVVAPIPGRRLRVTPLGIASAAVVVVIIIIIVGFLAFGRHGSNALQQGVDAYRAGQREAAVSDFNHAVRDDPRNPLPHIYLARMAREVGNFPLATQELTLALQDDPGNALALREMGANLLAQGNYDLARRFYVDAVRADPTDKDAMGYLGCTLMKLNRVSEATTFLNKAGPGPWSNCTPAAPGSPPANPNAITGQPAPIGVPKP